MKRVQTLTIITSLISLDLSSHFFLASARAATPVEVSQPTAAQVAAQGVTIPMVALTNSSLESTVKFLNEQTNEILKKQGGTALTFSITDPYKQAKPVTLYLSEVRLDDLCKQVATQSATKLSYTQDGIIFNAGPAGAGPQPGLPAGPGQRVNPDSTLKFARNLILPSIDFKEVSVEEAVDFLRLRSKELSSGQPGAVPNYIIMDPHKKAQTITLQLKSIPLEQVCNRIAEMSGLSVKYDQAAIVFKAN